MFVFKMLSRNAEQRASLIEDVAEFTELGDFLHMPVRTYSTGMQMRLSFGIATAMSPNILLMDEMISAGDASFYAKAQRRMQRMTDRADILIIASHSPDLITSWCNKAVWMEKGEVRAFDTVEIVMDEYSSTVN